jgi:hypothetical protein
MTTIL